MDEGERSTELRLKERRPREGHRVPDQQPEKHQRLDQGRRSASSFDEDGKSSSD